jgi:flagellar biogenesis protein FliO
METGQPTPSPWARLTGVRVGAVIAIVLAVLFLVWLLVRGGDDNDGATANTQTQTTGGPSLGPVAASVARLKALAVDVGHPVYWVGPKAKTTYELTRTSNGNIFVRYLPGGVPVGIRQAAFTIVGTYPVRNAMTVLRGLAKKSGEQQIPVPGGGIGVFATSDPSRVYVAYPGIDLQVEVFDPSPQRARALVASGQVAPVR